LHFLGFDIYVLLIIICILTHKSVRLWVFKGRSWRMLERRLPDASRCASWSGSVHRDVVDHIGATYDVRCLVIDVWKNTSSVGFDHRRMQVGSFGLRIPSDGKLAWPVSLVSSFGFVSTELYLSSPDLFHVSSAHLLKSRLWLKWRIHGELAQFSRSVDVWRGSIVPLF